MVMVIVFKILTSLLFDVVLNAATLASLAPRNHNGKVRGASETIVAEKGSEISCLEHILLKFGRLLINIDRRIC